MLPETVTYEQLETANYNLRNEVNYLRGSLEETSNDLRECRREMSRAQEKISDLRQTLQPRLKLLSEIADDCEEFEYVLKTLEDRLGDEQLEIEFTPEGN